jgi:competence protein ComEC
MKIYFLIIILSNIILAFVRTNHYENFIGRIEQEIRLKPHLEISGTILKVEERTKNTKVLIKVKSVKNNRHNVVRSNLRGTKGNLYFESESRESVDSETSSLIPGQSSFIPGQSITVLGEVSPLERSRNDGGYSERDNLYGQSIYFKMFKPSVQQVDRGHDIFRGLLYRFSVGLESEFHKNLPAEEGTLVSEMCIGTKSDGNEMVKELFRLAGIISLLSISGTHVSVVSRSLYNLLRKYRLSFLESMVISVMVALLYGGLCGNSISTVRAIACFSLMTFAQVLGMSYDSVTALAVVAYFMVIRNPYIVFNSSFQLSFGIMFGVVYVAYPASVRIRTTMRRVWNLKHKNSGVESYRLNTKDRIRIYVLMMFLIQLWSIPLVSFLFY